MASFIEDLWASVFTPGPTPTLLIATNATFATLQLLLLALMIATRSIHFVVLSVLSAGLWYSINWFAHELQLERAKQQENQPDKILSALDSDKSMTVDAPKMQDNSRVPSEKPMVVSSQSKKSEDAGLTRRRTSIAEPSDHVGTDSEWERVSESEDRARGR